MFLILGGLTFNPLTNLHMLARLILDIVDHSFRPIHPSFCKTIH